MAKILIVSANLKNWNIDSGGKERTANLIWALKDHDITFLSFSWEGDKIERYVDNNIYQVQPATPGHIINKYKKLTKTTASSNYDACFELLKEEFGYYSKKIKELSMAADILIVDHMSISPLIPDSIDIPIIYNSHNSEIAMAKQLYPDNTKLVKVVEQVERRIIKRSAGVTYCSKKDIIDLEDYYGKITNSLYVPNGTDMHKYTDYKNRMSSKNIIFIGSGHPPNIDAANKLIDIAKAVPEYNFIIIGSAGNGLLGKQFTRNLKVLGRISDEELDKYFRTSFAFINPMDAGSGTHLKMMRALSYGIPIITSLVGARGFSKDEISDSMIIAESNSDIVKAINILNHHKTYKKISEGGYSHSKKYDWNKIGEEYSSYVTSFIPKGKEKKPTKKEKVLVYSIIRNRVRHIDKFHIQLKKLVQASPEYEFYLSIYENDSTDGTKAALFSKDWSFFKGVSIICEDINTQYYQSVKDAQRVENLAKARNRAIEAGGFLNDMDYIFMVEGDITYKTEDARSLLNFKNIEPKFDIVSSMSIRKNGTHYDWWATRTGPVFNPNRSEIEDGFNKKEYGKYYSTSNGLCLYRAEPFKKGIRHHWINKVTKEFDCEMVVLCQEFHKNKYNNIYILYSSRAYHI